MSCWFCLRLLLVFSFAISSSFAQVAVTTFHGDNSRTGANIQEEVLTPANVNSSTFGLLFSVPITTSSVSGDGGVYAQPLFVPNVNIDGALHNVVYVATEQNMIFAFDADQKQGTAGTPLWSHQYGTPVSPRSVQNYLGDTIGIQSTPVVDTTAQTLYFVSATSSNGKDVHFLHAVDITNGNEKSGSPVQIQASVPGSGEGGSTIAFNANVQNQRPGLLLSNGTVYIAWGSYDDATDLGTYHGWVMAYDGATLAQKAVFNTTPNGHEGSTWALGALAADAAGNVFVGAANGDPNESSTDSDPSSSNYANAYMKLSASNLGLLDYFMPSDSSSLLTPDDFDGNGGGAVLLPDQPGPHPHLLVWGSKAGKIYLVDRDNMGMFYSNDSQIVQEIPEWTTSDPNSPNCQGTNGDMDDECVRTLPAYWNGNVYFAVQGHGIQAFSLSNGQLSTSPTSQDTANPYGLRGAAPVVSSKSDFTNGIAWAVRTDQQSNGKLGTLFAYDATNVAHVFYTSNQNASRDQIFPAQLFSVPTVANGKVYVAGKTSLYVFGLLASQSGQPPVASVALNSSGETVTASTSGSTDSDGNIVSSWIDWGDGTSTNQTTATHAYANPGTYTVVATVYDDSGRVSRMATTATPTASNTSTAVTTYHNDNARTGQQLNETILTPSNVNSSSFGKKYSFPVDGQVYAQPLYVPGLTINGATHNAVFVATEHDSVYAFDADGKQSAPLWHVSFINQSAGITPAISGAGDQGVSPEIGITGTPVIDTSTGTLYVVAMTNENGNNKFRLHALDITTGAERANSPALIQPSVQGSGAESVNNTITINPGCLQRTGLALLGNTVVSAFGSCSHGWVVGNDKTSLAQVAVYNDTANGKGAGIWMGGGAPAIDSNGYMYLITGADADSTDGPTQGSLTDGHNNSFLEFDPNMKLVDFFTPSNTQELIANDDDLGSGAVIVLPDNSSAHPHEMIGAGKDGRIFVLDRNTLGGFHSQDQAIQEVQGGGNPSDNYFDTPAFWNGNLYYHGEQGVLQRFTWTNGTLSSSPAATGSTVFGIHGATPSISANGTSNAILWELQVDQAENNGAAVLHAYDATNVGHELYNSSQAGSRDTAGTAVKFTVPTIADGKVFVGTGTELDVYGLLTNTPPFGWLDKAGSSSGGSSVPQNTTVTITGWAADQQDGSPVAQVQVMVDGTFVGNAALGQSRPDVATAFNDPRYANSGWTLSYNVGNLAPGTHTATAIAYDSAGASAELNNNANAFSVTSNANTPPFGWVDTARGSNGSSSVPQYTNVTITGWAADQQDGSPVARVQVLIDGTAIGNATLGVSRPDVASAFNDPRYTNSGWTLSYNVGNLAPGTHTATAIAYDSAGASAPLNNGTNTFSVTTTNANTPPFGWVDTARGSNGSSSVPQNTVVTITGWAADKEDGSPVARVQVLVDGTFVGNGTLGLSRPDVASAFNDPRYANSGWTLSYNVGNLAPGTHTATAIAYDSAGASASLNNGTNTFSVTTH